ncbi:hypothetical protein [Pseudomonas sp. PGPPP1]|uniref:hypothetical protein n=1 Tax=Pseudomonas sp. PGPPP1 TaxID=2015553 RepID=UPI0025808B8B|nr:hypothetical protein [Pseudomonas sp. PGPPP1]
MFYVGYTFGAVAMVWYGRRSSDAKSDIGIFCNRHILCRQGLMMTIVTTGHLWISLVLLAITTAGIAAITSLGSLAGVDSPATIGLIKTPTGSFILGLYAVVAVMGLGRSGHAAQSNLYVILISTWRNYLCHSKMKWYGSPVRPQASAKDWPKLSCAKGLG